MCVTASETEWLYSNPSATLFVAYPKASVSVLPMLAVVLKEAAGNLRNDRLWDDILEEMKDCLAYVEGRRETKLRDCPAVRRGIETCGRAVEAAEHNILGNVGSSDLEI